MIIILNRILNRSLHYFDANLVGHGAVALLRAIEVLDSQPRQDPVEMNQRELPMTHLHTHTFNEQNSGSLAGEENPAILDNVEVSLEVSQESD